MSFTTEELQKIGVWCKGDPDAISFVMKIFEVSQIADDFVDCDAPMELSKAMARLLHLALVEIPSNPFYVKYKNWFLPLFSTTILLWDATNDWAKSPNTSSRMFAWSYREIGEQIIIKTACITGGFEFARHVARDIHDFYHVKDEEKFEDWEAETWGALAAVDQGPIP